MSFRFLKIVSVFTLSFALGVPLWAAESAGGTNYAYVDVAKVFDDYQKTKENDRVLQDAGKKKEEERDAIVHEIRQLKDELALLADDAKTKKQDMMEAKVRDLQAFDQKAKEELGTQRNKVVKEIFKDIDDTIKRYGERKGLDFVFNERALVFHNPKKDVTTDIVSELNKGYTNKKA